MSTIAAIPDAAVQTFVTRQPIFDASGEVRAYELHYRSGPWTSNGSAADSDAATLQLLDTTFLQHAVGDLTDGLPAYLSFTEHTLIQDFAHLFPPEAIVIQIEPSVRSSEELLDACRRLVRRDYCLALDQLTMNDARVAFLPLAEIVKIDFLNTPEDELRQLAAGVRDVGNLLAMNIDTQVMRGFAESLGATLYQGDFLASPDPVQVQEIPVGKFERLRLLQQLNRPELNLTDVEQLIKRDPGLSYRLLMWVNSAAMGMRHHITDIRQAVIVLGQVGMMRWASVVALKDIATSRPAELLRESIFRARFCESVGVAAGMSDRSSELFLLGLFSRLDALTGRRLADLTYGLPLAADVKEALLGVAGPIRSIYDLVLAYDHGDWSFVEQLTVQLGIHETELPGLYYDALRFSSNVSRG